MSIFETIGLLLEVIDKLDAETPEAMGEADEAAAVIILGLIRNARKELAKVEDFAQSRAASMMTSDTFEAVGVRARRRQMADNVTWQNDRVATAVLVSAMVDENGELPSEEANIVACRVKEALVKCAALDTKSFAGWRIGELKARQIDASEYRQRTPGRFTVEVELADEAA